MKNIVIYSTPSCPYCNMAKQLLSSLDLEYKEIDLSANPEELEKLIEKTKMQTVPQIFINEKFIGGFDDLNKLKQDNELEALLND